MRISSKDLLKHHWLGGADGGNSTNDANGTGVGGNNSRDSSGRMMEKPLILDRVIGEISEYNSVLEQEIEGKMNSDKDEEKEQMDLMNRSITLTRYNNIENIYPYYTQ